MSAERAARLAELVAERDLEMLIVGDLVRPGDTGPDAIANVRWLTGFNGTSGLALVGPEMRTLITDFRYTERAERQVGDAFDRAIAESRLIPELASHLRGRVGFDDAATSVANLAKLEEELGEGVELVPAAGLVEQLRRNKDEREIAAIASAAELADSVYESVAADGLAGRTEAEVARAAAAAIRAEGAEPSFAAIVAAGPNGALPHAEPSDRRSRPASSSSGTWARRSTATARTARGRSRPASPTTTRARPTSWSSGRRRPASRRSARR